MGMYGALMKLEKTAKNFKGWLLPSLTYGEKWIKIEILHILGAL